MMISSTSSVSCVSGFCLNRTILILLPTAESQYDVQTYGIYADFSLGAKVYQDVEDTLKDLEVGILGEQLYDKGISLQSRHFLWEVPANDICILESQCECHIFRFEACLRSNVQVPRTSAFSVH
jgi:hypothetical protein